jgi:hypothetical protein
MNNQPTVSQDFERKKCKCIKTCNRCKAIKLIDSEKFN